MCGHYLYHCNLLFCPTRTTHCPRRKNQICPHKVTDQYITLFSALCYYLQLLHTSCISLYLWNVNFTMCAWALSYPPCYGVCIITCPHAFDIEPQGRVLWIWQSYICSGLRVVVLQSLSWNTRSMVSHRGVGTEAKMGDWSQHELCPPHRNTPQKPC